jgi:uncharacterized protein YpmB
LTDITEVTQSAPIPKNIMRVSLIFIKETYYAVKGLHTQMVHVYSLVPEDQNI